MQWGVTIGSIYFNSIDIIVFSLAVIAGIVGTLVGFAKAFSHHSGFIVGFFSGLMFTKMVGDRPHRNRTEAGQRPPRLPLGGI